MQWSDESFHPFDYYKIGVAQSIGDSFYLRVYSHVLWVVNEKDPNKGKRQVYDPIHGSVREYEMAADEIGEFKKYIKSTKILEEKKQAKLHTIKKPLSGANPVNFQKHETIKVLQNEYAITKAISSQPILGSYGAGPCVILALYDSKNKIALLAHISPLTNTNSLPEILDSLSKEHVCAHLFGGDSSSLDLCMDIVEFLEKENIKIINSDIVRSSGVLVPAASLAIDARNGDIYSPVAYEELNQSPDDDKRLEIVSFQITKQSLRKFEPKEFIALVLPHSREDSSPLKCEVTTNNLREQVELYEFGSPLEGTSDLWLDSFYETDAKMSDERSGIKNQHLAQLDNNFNKYDLKKKLETGKEELEISKGLESPEEVKNIRFQSSTQALLSSKTLYTFAASKSPTNNNSVDTLLTEELVTHRKERP